MNEPHRGYIELQSMHAFDYNSDLHLGHVRKCCFVYARRELLLTYPYSHRLPIVYARFRSPNLRWSLDALVPNTHSFDVSSRAEHGRPESLA